MKTNLICFAMAYLPLNAAFAEVRPNPLFSDNAVLQQQVEVPVWGTARDGESVTVEFQDQKVAATAVDGKWMVRLRGLKAGGPFTMTLKGDNTVVLKNLLVGEVWLCGGQSNMEWALSKSDGGEDAIAGSAKQVSATYVTPLLSHSPLEPMNFTAHVTAGKALLIGGTQFQQGAQGATAAALGIKPEDVDVQTTFLGGGFGRRIELDNIVQAAQISKAVKLPVKFVPVKGEVAVMAVPTRPLRV